MSTQEHTAPVLAGKTEGDSLIATLALSQPLAKHFERACRNPSIHTDLSSIKYPRYPVEYVRLTPELRGPQAFVVAWPWLLESLANTPRQRSTRPRDASACDSLAQALAEAPSRLPELANKLSHELTSRIPSGTPIRNECLVSLNEYTGRLRTRCNLDTWPAQQPVVSLLYMPYIADTATGYLSHVLDIFQPIDSQSLAELDIDMLNYAPVVLQLLWHTLKKVRTHAPKDGLAWGLVWSNHQLLFNARYAFEALQKHGILPSPIESYSWEEAKERLSKPPRGLSSYRDPNLPRLSRIARYSPDIEVLYARWVRNAAVITQRYLEPQCASEYVSFTYGAAESFLSYFRKLRELGPENVALFRGRSISLPRAPKPKPERAPRNTRFDRENFSAPFSVTLNAAALGFPTDARYVPMTVTLQKLDAQWHITLPLEMRGRVAIAANMPHACFSNFLVSREVRVHRGNVFLQLNSLSMEQDLYNVLLDQLDAMPDDDDNAYFNLYVALCQWILTGEEYLGYLRIASKGVASNGAVFETPFDTMEKRISLFLEKKATQPQKQRVIDAQRESGTRSARCSLYDRFVFWYVAQEELDKQPFQLNIPHYSQYMSDKWVPWRYPTGNVRWLIRPPSWTPGGEKPFVTSSHALAAPTLHSAYSPFTLDCPRGGQPVKGYVYADDMV